MTTPIEDIKNNANLIPFLGAYFILYGSVDLITFYKEFNIDIIHFINFSEIIFYFIRDLYIIITHVVVLFMVIIGFNYFKLKAVGNIDVRIPHWKENLKEIKGILDTIDRDNPKREDEQKIDEAKNLSDKTSEEVSKAIRRKSRINILLLFGGFLIVVQNFWLIYEYGWLSGLRFFMPVLISFGVGYFVKDVRLFMVIYGLVTLLTSAYFNSISNAEKIKSGKNYGLNIDIDGHLIQSDSSSYVIGKTDNYIFYHQSKLKKTTVYPTNKMSYMIIPDK